MAQERIAEPCGRRAQCDDAGDGKVEPAHDRERRGMNTGNVERAGHRTMRRASVRMNSYPGAPMKAHPAGILSPAGCFSVSGYRIASLAPPIHPTKQPKAPRLHALPSEWCECLQGHAFWGIFGGPVQSQTSLL